MITEDALQQLKTLRDKAKTNMESFRDDADALIKQKSSTFGECERNNCRRTVFDFCSNGDADKELENPYEIKITVREALETLNASKALLKQFREAEANIDEQIKQLEEFGANHCMDTIVKTVRLDEVCCCPEKENEE